MPAYLIYRDSPVGQPFDATAPLAFFPPKDSDELFDALRAEFPHLKTHSERMREATIAYLMQERAEEHSPATMAMPTPQSAETATTSPWLTSFPSMSTDSSNFSSPDMLGLATPSFGNSPQSQSAQLASSRQPSVARAVAPNDTTPPALDQMTGVFSLSDSTQPKQRIRRKMTEAEKAEYRKRRIVKACDKCSKRKRKCVHNQPEMESLAKTSQKVEKAKPTAHHKKASVIPMSLSPDPAPDSIPPAQPFVQGEDWFDFTLLEDPLPDMSFDDLLDLEKPLEKQQYVQNQWPWGTDADFSMMFKNDLPSQNTLDQQSDPSVIQQQELLFDHLQHGTTLSFTTGNKKYPVGVQPQQTWGGANGTGMRSVDLDVHQHLLGLGSDEQHQFSRGGANDQGMLWQGLGTDQQAMGHPSLQRTPHTQQNVESGDALFFDSHFGDGVGGPSSYSGATAPRKELTRNLKNPKTGEVLHDFQDGDDHSVHQTESTSSHSRTDRFDQANHRNRTNVRSVEGSGTKDLLQSATRPQQHRTTTDLMDDAALADARTADRGIATSPSAEIYRLRHRIPGAPAPLQTRPQTQQIVSRADSKVKGGVYLRLDTYPSTPSLTGLSAILPAEKPAHTRARNSTASNSSSDQDWRTEANMGFEGASASGAEHSSRPRAHGRSPLRGAASSGTARGVVDSSNNPRQQILHDTVRRRDHFGRVALAVCAAVLGGTLLVLCQASAPSVSLSMLLLALFAPDGTSVRESSDQSPYDETLAPHLCEGKKDLRTCETLASDGIALRGGRARFHGWKMTPHSSLRWCVGMDWTALCG